MKNKNKENICQRPNTVCYLDLPVDSGEENESKITLADIFSLENITSDLAKQLVLYYDSSQQKLMRNPSSLFKFFGTIVLKYHCNLVDLDLTDNSLDSALKLNADNLTSKITDKNLENATKEFGNFWKEFDNKLAISKQKTTNERVLEAFNFEKAQKKVNSPTNVL